MEDLTYKATPFRVWKRVHALSRISERRAGIRRILVRHAQLRHEPRTAGQRTHDPTGENAGTEATKYTARHFRGMHETKQFLA